MRDLRVISIDDYRTSVRLAHLARIERRRQLVRDLTIGLFWSSIFWGTLLIADVIARGVLHR